MSSDVFAQLASEHPELTGVLGSLRILLARGSSGSLFDPDALSSRLGEEAATALELLAEEGILRELEVFLCSSCGLPQTLADYETAMEEGEEYACSDCQRDMSSRPESTTRYELANPPPDLPPRSNEFSVLFVAADHGLQQGQHVIGVAREYDALKNGLEGSESFKLANPMLSATRQKLVDQSSSVSDVVHIAGHGNDRVISFLVDQTILVKSTHVVKETLAEILRCYRHPVTLCVLNACQSHAIAEHLVNESVVEAAIGWNCKVGDRTAIEFAKAFYSALGKGQPLAQAFALGKAACTGKLQPSLYLGKDIEASNLLVTDS